MYLQTVDFKYLSLEISNFPLKQILKKRRARVLTIINWQRKIICLVITQDLAFQFFNQFLSSDNISQQYYCLDATKAEIVTLIAYDGCI